eukprot:Blabericola_migrator_1__11940@NODE_72_length_15243_cov_214_481220_g65_i0_p4_GENE_NODE_72_length_15243_cov_214_481220_g65_i0NODE_72_length_15243_cov_214_481220_g65_i0_p4_ORF_typecomplete_len560_score89_50Catalaserel/PF06628_12/0_18_NODE_72_length_15243_cov_214_481220_g65_i02261905
MTRLIHTKGTRNTSTYINLLTLTVALAIKPIIADGEETWPSDKRARWDDEVNEIITEWTTISQELPPDEAEAIEASIASAVSEAMKEDAIRSRVLDMLSQVDSKNNDEASLLHEAVPCTSSSVSPVEAIPGPSRLMKVQEELDQHRLTPDKDSQLSPPLEVCQPNLRPGPPQLETRDMTLAEACVAYPSSVKTANDDRVLTLEAIKCSLQYIARCYEAGQSANPDDIAGLCDFHGASKFGRTLADVKACIIFDPTLEFRLFRLLLTAWNDRLPVIKIAGYTYREHQAMIHLLTQLFSQNTMARPFLTNKSKYHKHKTWMLMLMKQVAAKTGPITPNCVLQLMVEAVKKKIDWWRLCKTTTEQDVDDWIPHVPIGSLTEAAKGAAKLLHLFVKCPLGLLSDEDLSGCLRSLATAQANPVDVCERIWHATVIRSQQTPPPFEYKEPLHWIDVGPVIPSANTSALYSTAHREGFWARVSWLFQHRFAPVAKKVEIIWSLPHERQKAIDIIDVVAAIDACVGEAHQELSSPSHDAIQFASVADIVPAITLLKTHNATLVLRPV